MDEPVAYADFRVWLAAVGVEMHPALRFHNDPVTGWGLFVAGEPGADASVPAHTKVFRMPAALAITPLVARAILGALCSSAGLHSARQGADKSRAIDALASLDQRDTVILYLVLARCLAEADQAPGAEIRALLSTHLPYIRILSGLAPSGPISYTPTERSLLQQTSLGASVPEKQASLARSAGVARILIASLSELAREHAIPDGTEANATWLTRVLDLPIEKLWQWGEFCYSSRAFPATMVYPGTQGCVPIPAWNQGTGIVSSQSEDMAPVLLPGLDSFNHQRGAQVVWHVGRAAKPYAPADALFDRETRRSLDAHGVHLVSNGSAIAFEVLRAVQQGDQVFNNYGPKGNEELLFSYGFTIPNGPDDYVRLTLPAADGQLTVELSKSNTSQLEKAANAVAEWHGYKSEPKWHTRAYTDVAHMLKVKLEREQDSLGRAQSTPIGPEVRKDNLQNIVTYLGVQCDILAGARQAALKLASVSDEAGMPASQATNYNSKDEDAQ